MANPSLVPVELSRNLPWFLSRSRAQRYVGYVFILALFLLLAAFLTQNSPASSLASRFFSKGSTFYFYPNASSSSSFSSSSENHIEYPPNHGHGDGNTTSSIVSQNNPNSSSDGNTTSIAPLSSPNSSNDGNTTSVAPLSSPNSSSDGNTTSIASHNNTDSSSDGNASTAVKQNNHGDANAPSPSPVSQVEVATLNSRKIKTPYAYPPQPQKNHSDVNASSTTTTIEAGRSPNVDPPKANTQVAKDLKSCDLNDGKWVVDNSPPSYQPGSCPFVEEAFNCYNNGRVDDDFLRYRWQPLHCQIPRWDGIEMLNMLRGKRLAFVGDSLNRNMWESLVCVLREFLPDKNKVYEVSGRDEFKTKGFYSFRFEEYNCSIQFIRSTFLVEEWEFTDKKTGARKETLRLDQIEDSAIAYQDADVLIFNTAHWWTHPKTKEGKDYYQEGNQVYSKLEMSKAYTKALQTWSKWIDDNVDSNKTTIFFRGYSSSHFQGGFWNTGGGCENERTPITNDSQLLPDPEIKAVLESVLREMRTPVYYLNITRMTSYRKDAHPSVFREKTRKREPLMIQDCSHWCLPGVPDIWNQIVYAHLLTTHHNPQYKSS